MNKFRITKQRILFGGDEQITKENRTYTVEIEADVYMKIFDEVSITDDNLEYVQRYLNSNYRVGDTHKSPVKSISFEVISPF